MTSLKKAIHTHTHTLQLAERKRMYELFIENVSAPDAQIPTRLLCPSLPHLMAPVYIKKATIQLVALPKPRSWFVSNKS